MSFIFDIVKIVEVLVIVLIGFRWITQTFEMRWDYVWAKAILGLSLCGLIVALVVNGRMVNFSTIEYIFGFGCFFLLSIIFYMIPLRYAIIYNYSYWLNLLLFHLVLIIISSAWYEVNVVSYIMNMEERKAIYIIGMCIAILLILYLYNISKRNSRSSFAGKKAYVYLFCMLSVEGLAINEVLKNDMMKYTNDWKNIAIAGSFFVAVVSIGVSLIFYDSYMTERHQKQLLELNQNMVKKQYDYMQESYDDKRRQIHNSLHQYALLKEYMVLGKIEEAIYYLDELKNKSINAGSNLETGISSIDFIINLKRNEAEKDDIQIETEVNALFCPLERDDLCILLGNLMDNAIEATKKLLKSQRWIYLNISTANNIFMMKIENKYIGERKIAEGKYKTTKVDDDIHGLGVESCRMLVNRYNGTLEIKDDGETFGVEVIIFQDGN